MEPNNFFEVITHPHTYIKPLSTAGTIYVIDRFIRQTPNMSQSVSFGIAVGTSFFILEFVQPYLPKIQNSEFSTGAVEQRILEVGATTGILLAMTKLNLYTSPILDDRSGTGGIAGTIKQLLPVAMTVLIADIAGEGVLPFFGFSTRFHNNK